MKSATKKSLIGLAMFIGILGTLTFSFLHPHRAYGATRTWDGGCGVDTNWSCDANWSLDTEPVAGDTVTFDNTSDNNSTVDATFTGTVTTININSGYDGTITMARSLTVSTSFVQHAGTFTASNQTLDMNGSFTLDAGVFTASSGSTTLASAMTISGSPTFNHNSGTFTFDGASGATLSCNNVTFNLVTFTHTGANTKTISSSCSMPLGANPTVGGDGNADVTLNGTLTGSGTLTIGTSASNNLFTVNSTSPLSGFSTLSIGTLTISGGTFTAPATMNISSSFTLNSTTTWDANSGTINFNGAVGATLSCGNKLFNLVNFTHTGSNTKTVGVDCNLPLGANPTVGGDGNADVTLNGTLSGTGTLTIGTASSGNVTTFNSTASLSGFSGLASGTTTISGATLDFSSYSTFTINNAYSQTGGAVTMPTIGASFLSTFTINAGSTFTASSGATTFASTFTFNSGATFNANGGTVNFNGSSSTLSCGNAVFNLVTIANTSGAKTVSSDCSLPLGSNPTLSAGTGTVTLNGTLSGSGTLTSTNVLTINTGYVLSGFSGLSAHGLTVNATTANFGGYSFFEVVGSAFTLGSSSTFTAPSGTASFSSTFTINSGATFNANGGTINFNGAAATLSCGSKTFNLVTFTHSGGIKTVGSDCNLPVGNNPTFGSGASTGGDITLNGTISGTGTYTSGPVGSQVDDIIINSGGALSGFSGLVMNGTLTIAGATANFGSYNPMTLNRHFVLSSGIFTAPTGTMSVSRSFTLSPGTTFNANVGTIVFNGDIGGTYSCNSTVFNAVQFTHTSGTKTVNSDCSFPLGASPSAGNGGSITLSGTLSGSGTLTTTGTFTQNSGSTLSGFTGLVSTNYTANGSTSNFGTYNTFDVNGNFTIQSSTTLTATAANMTVGGNFTVASDSTFNHNSGTVILDGSNQIINGTTFNNLTKIVASADTLTMPANGTETILGTLTLKGGLSSALLTIVSSTPGTKWNIDAQGTTSVEYISVTDSDSIGNNITACASSGTNTTGWTFTASCGSGGSGSGGDTGSGSSSSSSTSTSSSGSSSSSRSYSGDAEITPQDETTSGEPSGSEDQSKVTKDILEYPKDVGEATEKFVSKDRKWLWLAVPLGLGLFVFIVVIAKRKSGNNTPPSSQVIPPSTQFRP